MSRFALPRRQLLIMAAASGIGLALCQPPIRAANAADTRGTADAADIDRVQDALNAIHTLKSRFQQVAADGAISHGTAWLDRPGRMRFQYDPPSPLLLVAGGGQVVFHDSELDQTSTIPLGNTPLGILLAPQVDLHGNVTVTSIAREPGRLTLTLVRADNPGQGSLALTFDTRPLALSSWIVTDAQHAQTRVSLSDVVLGGRFDPALFSYRDPNLPAATPDSGALQQSR